MGPAGATAELLWTSDSPFRGVLSQHERPLYALISCALREDQPELAPLTAAFVRTINKTLIVKPTQRFPPSNCTSRGGGFGTDDLGSDLSPEALRHWFLRARGTAFLAFLPPRLSRKLPMALLGDLPAESA